MTDTPEFKKRIKKAIDDSNMPPHTKEAFENYLIHHLPLGGFLESCVKNDFIGAVQRADAWNRGRLSEIALFVCNDIPLEARGDNYEKWIER